MRISIDHVAQPTPPEFSHRWMTKVEQVIMPWVFERGYEWEVCVDETPFGRWTVQEYSPPGRGSAGEARWIRENKPSASVATGSLK